MTDMELLMQYAGPIAAGVSVTVTFLAFLIFIQASRGEAQWRRRLASAKEHRAGLRAAAMDGTAPGPIGLKAMSDAVGRFKMDQKLWDEGLRLKLAQSGFRGRPAVIMYLFAQIVAPPILALVGLAYFHFMMSDPATPLSQYLMVGAGGFALGYVAPNLYLSNVKQKRQQKMVKGFPDALDLMTICVEAGMAVEPAFNRVSQEISPYAPELSEELMLTTAELSYLGDRRLALENFGARTDLEPIKAVVSALIQAERYGTSVGQALRVAAAESRLERLSRTERKAASLPTKMTIPMMVFFLPTLFIVILGPAIIEMSEAF